MRSHIVCLSLMHLVLGALAPCASAQDPSPLKQVQALGLDTMKVGRVTAYFASTDQERAGQLARLMEANAAFFERELGISFDIGVAALAPVHWFSEYPGIPYAIPWNSMPERLIFVPASLQEGLLVADQSDTVTRRRIVDYVLLHEYGHLAAKAYLRPASDRDYLPVSWFEEFLANYFAYAYIRSSDPKWADAEIAMWTATVESFTPPVLSLDWSFMNDLPPKEIARTYGWYQNLLTLRAAVVYEERGLDFLRAAKEQLAWPESGDWTSATVLSDLEQIAPGFKAWAADLEGGDYL